MEKLEEQIQQREKAYLEKVEAILKQEGTNRAKIALIYSQHIKCILAIEDMVADAQFEPQSIELLRVS
jgi:predicted patatin/cPLA2 family phospholipase